MNRPTAPDAAPSEIPAWLRLALALLLALYAGLFIFTSLSRTRRLSADSLNYIDVGRNLARGQGLVQSTLVIARPLEVWDESRTIAPFVTQPPLYPLAIAALGRLRVAFTDAALLVSALAFLAALGLGYLLTAGLYDPVTAWLAVAVLSLAPHLASLGRLAWSETLAIAWLLASLWLLVASRGQAASTGFKNISPALGWLWALAAGLAAGLAFAARYALGVLVLVGLVFFWIENRAKTAAQPAAGSPDPARADGLPSRGITARLAGLIPERAFWPLAGFYLAGWLLPVGWVLGHNWLAIGRLFPINLPADKGLLSNLADALLVFFGGYLADRLPAFRQLLIAGLFLLGIVLAAWWCGRPAAYFRERLSANGRYLLWLWPLIYLVFVVIQRSLSFFDELDLRLLAPAAVPLILLATALFTGLFARRTQVNLLGLAVALLGLALWNQLQLLRPPPAPSPAEQIAASPRLSWLAEHTTGRDLVIGDTANDIPYFFDRQAAVTFSPYPYTILLTPSTLDDLAHQYCPHYDSLYLVLRRRVLSETKLRQQFGRYLAGLWQPDLNKYPELELVADLPDSRVFRLLLCNEQSD